MTERNSSLERYLVAMTGLALVAIVAHVATTTMGEFNAISVLLATTAGLSTAVPIRFLRDGGIEGITVDEAMLLALLVGTGVAQAPLLLALAVLITHIVLRNGLHRAVYNSTSVAVAGIAGTTVYRLVGPGAELLAPRSLGAMLAAVVTFNLVTCLCLAGLFRRLEGQPYRSALLDTWHVINAVTLAGNAAFGILLAIVVEVHPFATLLAGLLIVGLHLGYRGYAGVLEERARNERLHGVARTLAEATGSGTAMSQFLAQLAELFGGERAELLVRSRGHEHLVCWDAEHGLVEGMDQRLSDPLEATLRDLAPVRVSVDAPVATAYRDAIAAPLLASGELVGAVAVYDRRGLEPWGISDLNLLSSLASEAAVAVRNAELVSSLREETKKLGDIVEAASDGIVLLDVEGVVVTWSPAMARMTSIPSDRAIGIAWSELLATGDEGAAAAASVAEVLSGQRTDAQVEIDLALPSPRWLRGAVSPVLGEKGPEGAVLVVRDVTAARETAELKADFVATVSHELRTPLTPLKGFLDTMAARWEQLEPEQIHGMFAGMQRQMDRLGNLVGDLLLVADLDRGGMVLQREVVDVSDALDTAIDELRAGRERIQQAPPVHGRVMGDNAAIVRIVSALIDNGLKHTEGVVRVAVVTSAEEVVLEVSDDGPGIPAWEQERIFERFGRAGHHLTRNQGPGLGLTIAQSLTERLGGTIEVASEPGAGSTFRVRLPALQRLTLAS